ncbi:protein ENHANCED DISEASE RESISTANCE 2 isoform X3 [Physcomitrium patens]|uniref:protein ENHANCED DISEASE RESISTANCE 2 isoform X3 n=1 Tax=Physcomitrium patens TaxID=3218 RepID=UPI000D1661BA|nr:protein ENHANCED DISEASE RESISTANCE 2-like isoform X3 [Physcomitrium patens]|eukprot:XP_024402806.1 protein ENHANCED DISEASE RESISTANCE 2-like isoform X3 [Physcomitrella patens]
MASTIEGYLYSFGPSRQGGVYCIQTFCVLSGRHFSQCRHKGDLVTLRSGILDVDHRVEDTGRQIVNDKVLYTLRLYNVTVTDAKKEVLVGALNSEEIAEWLKAFTSSLGRPFEFVPAEPCPSTISPAYAHLGEQFVGDTSPAASPRLEPESPMFHWQREKSYASLTTIGHESPTLAKSSSSQRFTDLQSTDGGQASKWKLVRCENGLRFFKEASSFPFVYKLPVMKAVGVVNAPADQIFNLIMDYGPERQQWDHTLECASVIEVIDGHSDVVYIRLRQDWGFSRQRDLCLSRYWKREESGAYSVFYRSILKHPLQAGLVRAYIHSGGYVVTPLKTTGGGKPRTLVESVLEMDAAGWSSLLGAGFSSYPAQLRDSLLRVVAGLREHVAAQRFNSCVTIIKRHILEEYPEVYPEDSLQAANLDFSEAAVSNVPFLSTSDDIEEFFDATMDQFSDSSEQSAHSVSEPTLPIVEHHKPLRIKVRSDRGIYDLSKFRGNVVRGPLQGGKHSFSEPDSSVFLLQGINSLSTGSRVPAGQPFCKLIGMDWFKSKDRIDHVAGRSRSLVQRACSKEGLFFFVVNLQIPYTSHYSWVFYFVTEEEIVEGSLLHRFISGDDTFRNSRLSLIPAIPEGSWIVRQAVGTKSVPLGQIVEVKYHVGFNYMEGETADELPERLIGVGRCSHIQLDKAVDLSAT